MPGRTDGLITLVAADALWVDLTADSAVPTASGAFTCSPARARAGYVLLGGHVVATVGASNGQWNVPEVEVRRAAAELNAVGMDRQDLVRIGPFRGAPRQECNEETPLRWRQRIKGDCRSWAAPSGQHDVKSSKLYHLAGIDWRQMLVEQTRDGTQRTWWLPRAVVRLLDAAEHAETQWVQAARTRQASAAVTEPPSRPRQARDAAWSADDEPRGPHRLTAPVQQRAGRPAVLGAQQEDRYLPQGGWVGVRRLPHCARHRARPLPRTRLRPRPRLPVL